MLSTVYDSSLENIPLILIGGVSEYNNFLGPGIPQRRVKEMAIFVTY